MNQTITLDQPNGIERTIRKTSALARNGLFRNFDAGLSPKQYSHEMF